MIKGPYRVMSVIATSHKTMTARLVRAGGLLGCLWAAYREARAGNRVSIYKVEA